MRLRLIIDGYPLEICTRSTELLARWIVDVFSDIEWTPATLIEVQASALPVRRADGRPPAADWLTRAELTGFRHVVASPREVAEALLADVHRAEQLAEADQAQELAEADPP